MSEKPQKSPRGYRGLMAIVFVVFISTLPALLQFVGAGLETGVVEYKQEIVDAITGTPVEAMDYGLIRGMALYSLLEWTVVLLAGATALLAYVHFHVKRRLLSILISLSAFWVAAITAFQLLTIHGINSSVVNLSEYVQFNWTMSQTFTALMILAAAGVVLWRGDDSRGLREHHVLVTVGALSGLAYAIIFVTARASTLPVLTYPERLISRPLELFSLLLFVTAAVMVLPMLDKKCRTPFSMALWVGSIPLVASQLYMTIPSQMVFDHGFTAAQLTKTLAFAVIFAGLVTDYARACRQESKLSRRLSVNDRHIRMFFDNAVEAIITFDEKRRVRNWNRRAEEIFGPMNWRWSGGDVLDVMFEAAGSGAGGQRRQLKEALKRFQDDPKCHDQLRQLRELHLRRQTLVVEYSIVPAPGDKDTLFAVLARDVTEQRRLQREMARMNRLVSVGTLAAGIVHELRNPLTYVISNVQLARESIRRIQSSTAGAPSALRSENFQDSLDELEVSLDEANEGIERVHRIIDDMRSFSRRRQEKLEPIDVERPLRIALRMTRGELQHRARVKTHIEKVSFVEADETRLSQVFVNLMTNAVHAMDKIDRDEHLLSIDVFERDEEVVLRFRDTGAGMSEAIQSRIFQPFFTTKSAENGTGLGLSLSRSIIESFGGRIDVESTPGEGTTFEIGLPAK